MYIHHFVAEQETSRAKFSSFLQRFENKERILRVNKTNSTGENVCNGDYFET